MSTKGARPTTHHPPDTYNIEAGVQDGVRRPELHLAGVELELAAEAISSQLTGKKVFPHHGSQRVVRIAVRMEDNCPPTQLQRCRVKIVDLQCDNARPFHRQGMCQLLAEVCITEIRIVAPKPEMQRRRAVDCTRRCSPCDDRFPGRAVVVVLSRVVFGFG